MAEANDPGSGQDEKQKKKKEKNPVVENDSYPIADGFLGSSDDDVAGQLARGKSVVENDSYPIADGFVGSSDDDVAGDPGSGQDEKHKKRKEKEKNPVVENDSYPIADGFVGSSDDDVAGQLARGKSVVENDSYPIADGFVGSSDDDVAGDSAKKRRKKKRREKEKEKEKEGVKVVMKNINDQDPLVLFGSDIMMKILRHLDARSVALSLLVSRGWYGVASSDRLWTAKCEQLWLGKAHIPRSSQVRGLSKLAAHSISVMDGRRTRIMKEDLCDHVWEFHFNEAAPEYWRNLDPYWKGTGPPMRRYFHPDGSLTADPGDEVWGGQESCYSIITSFMGDGTIRDHYVRINRWPRMLVLRKEDWSWEMSNNLYCYSSIPDADKEGGTGPLFPFS